MFSIDDGNSEIFEPCIAIFWFISNCHSHNPIPLLVAGASYLAPKIIEKVSERFSKSPPTQEKEHPQHIITDSKDKANYSERVINQVMKNERLY